MMSSTIVIPAQAGIPLFLKSSGTHAFAGVTGKVWP
jgi:hypothetical protein